MIFSRAFRAATVGLAVIGFASLAIAQNAAPPAANAAATDQSQQAPAIEIAAAKQPADIVRGKTVFQTTADCVYCHGWPGDGSTGRNPRSPGIAANLRETQLDTDTMIQVVSCGIPGTAMPYHDRQAYKDPRCFGTTLKDYKPDQQPSPGHLVSPQDIINVVAYVQQKIKGRGPITKAECEEYFKPGAAACASYK